VIPERCSRAREYEEASRSNRSTRTSRRSIPKACCGTSGPTRAAAIARFDRSAIEIRVIDVQECPRADLADRRRDRRRSARPRRVATYLRHGCLARRIVAASGPAPDAERLRAVYAKLCDCLREGRPFVPDAP
jgi:hypothetical protein